MVPYQNAAFTVWQNICISSRSCLTWENCSKKWAGSDKRGGHWVLMELLCWAKHCCLYKFVTRKLVFLTVILLNAYCTHVGGKAEDTVTIVIVYCTQGSLPKLFAFLCLNFISWRSCKALGFLKAWFLADETRRGQCTLSSELWRMWLLWSFYLVLEDAREHPTCWARAACIPVLLRAFHRYPPDGASLLPWLLRKVRTELL